MATDEARMQRLCDAVIREDARDAAMDYLRTCNVFDRRQTETALSDFAAFCQAKAAARGVSRGNPQLLGLTQPPSTRTRTVPPALLSQIAAQRAASVKPRSADPTVYAKSYPNWSSSPRANELLQSFAADPLIDPFASSLGPRKGEGNARSTPQPTLMRSLYKDTFVAPTHTPLLQRWAARFLAEAKMSLFTEFFEDCDDFARPRVLSVVRLMLNPSAREAALPPSQAEQQRLQKQQDELRSSAPSQASASDQSELSNLRNIPAHLRTSKPTSTKSTGLLRSTYKRDFEYRSAPRTKPARKGEDSAYKPFACGNSYIEAGGFPATEYNNSFASTRKTSVSARGQANDASWQQHGPSLTGKASTIEVDRGLESSTTYRAQFETPAARAVSALQTALASKRL